MRVLARINTFLIHIKKQSNIDIFQNILVVSNTGLGDTILSTPSIISLRKSFPDIKITFMVNKKYFPLFENFEFADDFISYSSGFFNQLKIILNLKRRKIDTIFLFHSNGPEDVFFSVLSGAINIFKMTDNHNHDFKNIFLNQANNISQHDIEKKLDLIRPYNPKYISTKMKISEYFYNKTGFISKQDGYKYIGLQLGAQDEYKMWPYQNFISLVNLLNLKHKKLRFVVIGNTKLEKKIAKKLEDGVSKKKSILNFCGNSTISQLPIILNDLDLLLTNDTGTMHLSIALTNQTISLFGPTNPIEFGPYQDSNKHLVINGANSDFVKNRRKDFKTNNKMNNITIEMVSQAIEVCLEK